MHTYYSKAALLPLKSFLSGKKEVTKLLLIDGTHSYRDSGVPIVQSYQSPICVGRNRGIYKEHFCEFISILRNTTHITVVLHSGR